MGTYYPEWPTMLFGPLSRMVAVPVPMRDSTWHYRRTGTNAGLASGGRTGYLAPTPYRSYALKYTTDAPDLLKVVDILGGVYGPGPFYMADLGWRGGNILPPRWATGSMLRPVAGSWCNAASVSSSLGLDGSASVFTNQGAWPALGNSQTVIVPATSELHMRVFGAASGGAVVKVSRMDASGTWTTLPDVVPSASPADSVVVATAEVGAYRAVKLQLYVPSGGSMTVAHVNLTDTVTATPLPGRGAGPFMPGQDAGANFISDFWDVIGLAFDLEEVEE